jgi:hypothetical protein
MSMKSKDCSRRRRYVHSEIEVVGADEQKYSDLIDLYQGKKMHDKALTMLEECVPLRKSQS